MHLLMMKDVHSNDTEDAESWCLFRCIFNVLFCAVEYSQYVHLNGFSPVTKILE